MNRSQQALRISQLLSEKEMQEPVTAAKAATTIKPWSISFSLPLIYIVTFLSAIDWQK